MVPNRATHHTYQRVKINTLSAETFRSSTWGLFEKITSQNDNGNEEND